MTSSRTSSTNLCENLYDGVLPVGLVWRSSASQLFDLELVERLDDVGDKSTFRARAC